MECKCHWFEAIVAVLILAVTLWPNLIGQAASWWVVVILAAALLLHSVSCKKCRDCDMPKKPAARKKK